MSSSSAKKAAAASMRKQQQQHDSNVQNNNIRTRVRRELRLIEQRTNSVEPFQRRRMLSSNGTSSPSSCSSSSTSLSPLPPIASLPSPSSTGLGYHHLQQQPEAVVLLKSRLAEKELEIELLRSKIHDLTTADKRERAKLGFCSECAEKDELIASFSVKGHEEEDEVKSEPRFDIILRNIADLNRLVTEKERHVSTKGQTASFDKAPVVCIAFYSNGFRLDSNRFRPYEETSSRSFLKDLEDGFFPSELQGEFPEGVAFLAKDKRFQRFSTNDSKTDSSAFQGQGRTLLDPPSPSIKLMPAKKMMRNGAVSSSAAAGKKIASSEWRH